MAGRLDVLTPLSPTIATMDDSNAASNIFIGPRVEKNAGNDPKRLPGHV